MDFWTFLNFYIYWMVLPTFIELCYYEGRDNSYEEYKKYIKKDL
jgi:hypothetical protein